MTDTRRAENKRTFAQLANRGDYRGLCLYFKINIKMIWNERRGERHRQLADEMDHKATMLRLNRAFKRLQSELKVR